MLFYFRNVLLGNLSIVFWQLDDSCAPLFQDIAQSKHDLLQCLWELFLIVYVWQSTVDSLQKYTSNIGCLFRMFNAKRVFFLQTN